MNKTDHTTITYSCKIYDKRYSICRDYPLNQDAYFFENCQYIKDGKLTESKLSEEEQQKYCMECGLCCFANVALIKNKKISSDMENTWREGSKCKFLQINEEN